MEGFDALELITSGLETAQQQGVVLELLRETAPDYEEFRATTKFDNATRTVFVRCYAPQRTLTATDIASVDSAAKRIGAHMVLVVGNGQDALCEAKLEGISVLPYDTVPNLEPDFWPDLFKLTMQVYGFRFRSEQLKQEFAIPEEPALLAYMMRELRIVGDAIDTTPEKLVEENDHEFASLATSVPRTFSLQLPPCTFLIHPNTNVRTAVTTFSFEYRLVPVSDLLNKQELGKDHYLLGNTLQTELAKRNPDVRDFGLELGFDTRLRFGTYYYNPKLQFSYYCESARKGRAKMVLLESYQGGGLLQARFEVPFSSASQFVEVTNPEEVERLSKLYDRFIVSDKNLEGRFTAFVETLDDAECIDDLPLTPEQERAQKADYFFNDRAIISEFKSLQSDTSAKINAILEPYQGTPEWPLLYGEQELQKVLSFLPDSKEVNARIVTAVTDSIENAIETANRQIRKTKETFGLPDSGGLLVIFNDVVDVLSPDVVAYRVRKALTKKTHSGEVRFPHITVVLVINTGHYVQVTPDLKGLLILVIPSGLQDLQNVESFARSLLPRWSTFDGQPFLTMKSEDFPKLTFERFQKPAKQSRMKRDDFWRSEYKRSRYLVKMTNDEVLEYGRGLFEDIAPRFLKGAPKTPQDYMAVLMQRFTHFLEETALRELDLRRLVPDPNDLKERLESLFQQYNAPQTAEAPRTRAKQRRQSKAYKNKIGRGAPCPCKSGKTYSRCHGRKSKTS